MPLKPTDEWMDKHLNDPDKLLALMQVPSKERQSFYQYLLSHGMFRPTRSSENLYYSLKKKEAWKIFAQFENKYRSLWNGPSHVPIYLFPVQERKGFFSAPTRKSGVSFKDKVFIFISSEEDKKEWEAIFVHEYHHCVRMNQLKAKGVFRLADSIIFEGLAEYAVKEYCGEKYTADWTNLYSEKQLKDYWGRYVKNEINTLQSDAKHDQILLGKGIHPKMLGYAMGYYIVNKYAKTHKRNTLNMLTINADEFYSVFS